MTNDLNSITELRSKRDSGRFLHEGGYLFEGLEAQGALGVRKASCVPSMSLIRRVTVPSDCDQAMGCRFCSYG